MKQTRYMTWGHNIATVSAIALFMGGLMLVSWKNLGLTVTRIPIGGYGLPHANPPEWSAVYDGTVAGIASGAGLIIFLYERSSRSPANSGIKRRAQLLRHAIAYLFVGGAGACTLPTSLDASEC